MITLYDYFRSSASYRVRIALYMKGQKFESKNIDLVAGEQRSAEYTGINPQGAVPFLVDGKTGVSQSLAIIEYLDEKHPEPALIFGSPEDRAYIRQLSLVIACDIHPLNNPKVWKGYVGKKLGANEEQMQDWYQHWIHQGFKAYEALLNKYGKAGKFSFGDRVSMADLCLVPQVYNARRFNLDLSAYPKITGIEKNCIALPAFQQAAPESHRDAPEDLEQVHGKKSPLLETVDLAKQTG